MSEQHRKNTNKFQISEQKDKVEKIFQNLV